MTARIDTLAKDLQNVIGTEAGRTLAKDCGIQIGALVAKKMENVLSRVDRARKPQALFPSELGHPCDRKVWFEFHYDPLTMLPKETLRGDARIKFAYGDIIESMIIPLIHVAGHEVTDVNTKVEWRITAAPDWVVRGAMDCRVDGHVVDVKSMNARSFDMWSKDPNTADKFGYAYQLASYVQPEEGGAAPVILGVNKENGAIDTFSLSIPNPQTRAALKAMAVENKLTYLLRMPTKDMGKSGNKAIGMTCSYCPYKLECWKDANGGRGLRKFIYSTGPVWLTEVPDVPRVIEELIPV